MNFRIQFVLILVFCALAVKAQEAPPAPVERHCTDLSGRVSVPCPNAATATPAAGAPAGEAAQIPAEPLPGGSLDHREAVPAGGSDPAGTGAPAVQSSAAPRSIEHDLLRNFVSDQKTLWSSPLRLRLNDLNWLVPLAGATTMAVYSDTYIERKLPSGANFIKQSKSFSNYGAVGFAGLVGSAYLWSRATNNDHLRETAVLSGEAAIDSLLITEPLKAIAGRNRPLEGDGTGQFRSGGTSFPSEHSAAAWAIASVVAREYPSPFMAFVAYGGAAAISAARVTGRQHFASDVLVGSALGWFIGRHVYNSHHDRQDAAAYGTFERARSEAGPREAGNMGSPYVPLDSWVYPVMDRVAALGLIPTASLSARPWTRMECARLVEELGESVSSSDSGQPYSMYEALAKEFAPELRRRNGEVNREAVVESIYTRFGGTSGQPIEDGYHFSQTIVNDFGRPHREGFDNVTGISARATAGPFAFYVRGEYQRAAGAPALPLSAREAIAVADLNPVDAPSALPRISRFRLLDSYVALNLAGWQATFGKQSLWWGPGAAGPMLFSNNAEPVTMLRLHRAEPFTLPGPFKLMGPVRAEFFLGQLSGYRYMWSVAHGVVGPPNRIDPQPFINGQKLTFKPTPNLEFGISKTTVFAGMNSPLTTETLLRSIFDPRNAAQGASDKPGDRRTGFDFSYHIPKLRKWLVLYNDSYAEDEISPLGYPRRSAMNPGVYMPQLPKLPKMDLRLEASYTDLPNLEPVGFYYYNLGYRSGYTNAGALLGNWVGRDGRGLTARSTYWITPQSWIQVGYRNHWVDPQFAKGGQLNDYNVRAELQPRSDLTVSSFVQYEHWNFPALSPVPQSNWTASVQVTFSPMLRIK